MFHRTTIYIPVTALAAALGLWAAQRWLGCSDAATPPLQLANAGWFTPAIQPAFEPRAIGSYLIALTQVPAK